MMRRLVEGTLSGCVILLMFGAASVADELVFIDLSQPQVEQPMADDMIVDAGLLISDDQCLPESMQISSAADVYANDPGAGYLDSCPPELSAGQGYGDWRRPSPHFHRPSRSYSVFPSPVSYGWEYRERCAPTLWKPRGNGIPRRTSCYRMDYSPYELQHLDSRHGPAFYRRFNLYPCEECHLHQAPVR